MNITELTEKYTAGIRDFRGIDLSEANLKDINLSNANLAGAKLSVTNLSGANLSEANLQEAKLNVARLSDANLSQANLERALLNVANLIRADLSKVQLRGASMIRVELIRAELSRANLEGALLNGSDVREAILRQANLSRSDLSESNLQGALLIAAILEQTNLYRANLSRADLTGANLKEADMRQALLHGSTLNDANISYADLSEADLSGANLSGADLSNANLTGAKLKGANLKQANLVNTNFSNADLGDAILIQSDLVGADLTGANLTGAKLYGVSRFGVEVKDLICEWVDLSFEGNGSRIHPLNAQTIESFFNESIPKVQIFINAPITIKANAILANLYEKIAKIYPALKKPPSLEIGFRKTTFSFELSNNEQLFTIAYLAIFLFSDRTVVHRYLTSILKKIKLEDYQKLTILDRKRIQQLNITFNKLTNQLTSFKDLQLDYLPLETSRFFQAPTQTILVNSSSEKLEVYQSPSFDEDLLVQCPPAESIENNLIKFILPSSNIFDQE